MPASLRLCGYAGYESQEIVAMTASMNGAQRSETIRWLSLKMPSAPRKFVISVG
jgi:hypothetical protein